MKKKRVLKGILIVILLVIVVFGKVVYDDIKLQRRADAILGDIINKKIELKDVDYNSLGRYGAFVKEFGEFYVKLESDLNNLQSELKMYENNNVLDIKYIKNPEEGKQQVKQFTDAYFKIETLLNEGVVNFQKLIEKSPLSTKVKEELKKGAISDIANISNEYKPLSTNVQSMKTNSEALYDFLISIKGKYTVKKDELIFDSQKDLDKYNELEKAVLAIKENIK